MKLFKISYLTSAWLQHVNWEPKWVQKNGNEHDGNKNKHRCRQSWNWSVGRSTNGKELWIENKSFPRELFTSFPSSPSAVCSHLEAFNFNLIMSILSAGMLKGWCWKIFHAHVVSCLSLMEISHEDKTLLSHFRSEEFPSGRTWYFPK